MITDRLRRAICLIQLLQQSHGLTLREIAQWLDCSKRTVYRDLRLLKQSGFEVVWSPHGYQIAEETEMPRAALESDELLALLTTIQASPLVRDGPTRARVQRALQKLIAACSPTTRTRWLQLTRRLTSTTLTSSAASAETIARPHLPAATRADHSAHN